MKNIVGALIVAANYHFGRDVELFHEVEALPIKQDRPSNAPNRRIVSVTSVMTHHPCRTFRPVARPFPPFARSSRSAPDKSVLAS